MFGRDHNIPLLRSFPFVVFLTFLFTGPLLFAEESAADQDNGKGGEKNGAAAGSESEREEKWTPLFDGKTLGCWENGGDAGGIEPTIKDGCLVLGMGAMSSGVRYNEEKAGKPFPKTNYEIEYVAKRQLGNDFFAAMTFPVGDSACTLINGGWGGTLFGLSSLDNMDASENNTSSYYAFKNKMWYVFRIRVTDRVITAWLDDEKMIETFTDGHEVSIRIEMSRYQPFGIASWITEGWVRSIRYRLLDESEIAELNDEADRRARSKMRLPL